MQGDVLLTPSLVLPHRANQSLRAMGLTLTSATPYAADEKAVAPELTPLTSWVAYLSERVYRHEVQEPNRRGWVAS